MTDTEKLALLINKLKEYAEAKHCYDIYGDFYDAIPQSSSRNFRDGIEYGEILFARTMLESLGVKFEYPCMEKEND
jgi:hypothetical protein